MIAGAHFSQQPPSAESIPDVAGGLRGNLGHYGPYSGTGCFDLILDLTRKAETPEPYRTLLCPETGRLYQLARVVVADLEWLFMESCVMAELQYMLESQEIRPDMLNLRLERQA